MDGRSRRIRRPYLPNPDLQPRAPAGGRPGRTAADGRMPRRFGVRSMNARIKSWLQPALAWVLLFFSSIFAGAEAQEPPPSDSLEVVFLDVGQGDAVLVRSKGSAMLVDSGPEAPIAALRRLGVEQIDLLVSSHAHADHIGGALDVLSAFPVRFYMDNGVPHTTRTYLRLMQKLDAMPDVVYLSTEPRTIALGEAAVRVLPQPPSSGALASHNNQSVALAVTLGKLSVLLTGDAEEERLDDLERRGALPEDVTVLKASHHGSSNGFTRSFLERVNPEVVVISLGRNSYGHPHPSAVAAYQARAKGLWRTDENGQVTVMGSPDGGYRVFSSSGSGPARTEAADVRGAGPAGGWETKIRLSVMADAPGNDNRNPNGEYAVLANTSDEAINIGGWRLCEKAGKCYTFPVGARLEPGKSARVYTGQGQSGGEAHYMGQRRAVWNNAGDVASLYDASGRLALRYEY